MSDENRWSINELQARYELEPQLFDVYVEGAFDRDVLNKVGSLMTLRPTIYEVDVVDIPIDILRKYNLTSGNKQRVIALAQELDTLSKDAKVSCIVDRDLDHWFQDLKNTQRLRWSKYSSLECHFINREIISDILLTASKARIKNFEIFLESLYQILKKLCSFRISDKENSLSLKWVALRKYLGNNGGVINFDSEKYITALLASNGKSSRRDEFVSSCDKWVKNLDCDIRLIARGHDFTELMAWSIMQFDGLKEFASESAVQRLFILLACSVPTVAEEFQ